MTYLITDLFVTPVTQYRVRKGPSHAWINVTGTVNPNNYAELQGWCEDLGRWVWYRY